MNKCIGCGAYLQTENPQKEGYVKNETSSLCERCFRIQNYNDYQKNFKDNKDFIKILEQIKKTKELVVVVVDLFHTIRLDILSQISNDVLLVLTKRDLLPHSLYEQKLIEYFEKKFSNVVKTVIISSKNNYHYDELYEAINQYRKGDIVYVVGYTNAGKSTMINRLIYHYTKQDSKITTSSLPSTTLSTIEVPLNSVTLVDTPGILEEGSILNQLSKEEFEKVIPKKEIRPIVYQIQKDSYFKIDDFMRFKISQGDVVFYFSNQLKIERVFHLPQDLKKYELKKIRVKKDEDIVIIGIGFIKVKQDMEVELYLRKGLSIYTRDKYL